MTQPDDRFDAWLSDSAKDYHAPPADVPRDEMWQVIAGARRARPVSIFRRRTPWTLAAAAALLLAVGYGLGRMSDDAAPNGAAVVANDTTAGAAYRVAATRHLASAEAFVTAVRMAGETAADSMIRRWARELLTDTRLLLDSPAAEDVRRRVLLQDLELLLVQVVQLEDARTSDTNERLLDTSLQEQLLTRLRATVPAGPPPRT